MKKKWASFLLYSIPPFAISLAPTDIISDADPAQSGYLPNHNTDPAVVNSQAFKILWNQAFNAKEVFYAKPLVYTPPSTNRQIVLLASSQNWVRTLDAVTGAVITSRQVQTAFNAAEVNCSDTVDFLGVTGTPAIDPKTDTAYFFVKTYIPNYRVAGNAGLLNGVYYFYAVNVITLADVLGFPVLIDGSVAQNDHLRHFHGGLTIQRTSMTLINGVVFGGFAGHCDQFNYTGMIIGVSTITKNIVSAFAMEAGPGTKHQDWNVFGGGGQAGIWMSGMALATLGDGRMFFGNGQAQLNAANPAPGSSGLSALDQCIVNIAVSASGNLSLTDYFEPFDYVDLDGQDSDLGSGGIALLDKHFFYSPKAAQIGVVVGKAGTTYIVNADNLGGYKQGPSSTDAVLQTLQMSTGVWGGCGSYPLEGGYIYCATVSSNTFALNFSSDNSGNPVFTQVAKSRETNSFGVSVGAPTITSYKGQPGTGIVWSTDPDGGLRAWAALPGSDGYLKSISIPKIPGIWKYQRPAFGDGRLYVLDISGTVHCMGT